MRRREFITLSAARRRMAARGARAAAERVRRIGVLMNASPTIRVAGAARGFHAGAAGARAGSTAAMCASNTAGALADGERVRQYAAELIALQPDVIWPAAARPSDHCSRQAAPVPIVFAQVVDPVGAGLVESLARPGGNATGFTQFEYSLSGKWLELLKEIAPAVTRVGGLREPGTPPASVSGRSSRRPRSRSAWSCGRSSVRQPGRDRARPSPHSRANRMAV